MPIIQDLQHQASQGISIFVDIVLVPLPTKFFEQHIWVYDRPTVASCVSILLEMWLEQTKENICKNTKAEVLFLDRDKKHFQQIKIPLLHFSISEMSGPNTVSLPVFSNKRL